MNPFGESAPDCSTRSISCHPRVVKVQLGSLPIAASIEIVPLWWPIACAITLVGAGLGALYPGLSAARHDPIEALAYE